MDEEFTRTLVSLPGAAIREFRIDIPKHLRDAISESLDRGKRAGNETQTKPDPRPQSGSSSRRSRG